MDGGQVKVKNCFSSWWSRRTTTERLIIPLGVTLLISAFVTSLYIKSLRNKPAVLPKVDPQQKQKTICLTTGCIHTASQIIRNLDITINPCDDFYHFTCGGYLKRTIIPDDKTEVSSMMSVQDSFLYKLKGLFEEPISLKEANHFTLIKRLYRSCMNVEAIEADKYYTLENFVLKPLGGWPVLESKYWNERVFDWKNLTYQLREMGLPINIFLDVNEVIPNGNASRWLINIGEANLLLNRSEYLEGLSNKVVQSYFEYMVDIALFLGADVGYARKELKRMLLFEVQLAKLTALTSRNNDEYFNSNHKKVSELSKRYSNINWTEFLSKVINLPQADLEENVSIIVKNEPYVEKLLDLLAGTPKRVQANYALFRTINNVIPYLPEEISNRQKQFYKTIYWNVERISRWKECVLSVTNQFPLVARSLYIETYFNDKSKHATETIAKGIRAQLSKILENLEWIDEITLEKAAKKVNAVKFHFGYNDSVKIVEEAYENFTVITDNYLIFTLNLQKLKEDVFPKLSKSIFSPISTNYVHLTSEDTIAFPVVILQKSILDVDRSNNINYGSLGFLISRELIRWFYEDFNQKWWTEGTEKVFSEKAKCFIEQYKNSTEMNASDEQSVNSANNGGLNLAYAAYQAWVYRNGDESLLPGLNYTQNQMFWISAANTFCAKVKKKAFEYNFENNVYPSTKLRVNLAFINTYSFGKDFNCPLGSKMNPKEKCDVW